MDRLAASPATVVVVLHELEDTWTEVGWERLAAADPDVIYFVDYPGQTHQQKVDTLKATRRHATSPRSRRNGSSTCRTPCGCPAR